MRNCFIPTLFCGSIATGGESTRRVSMFGCVAGGVVAAMLATGAGAAEQGHPVNHFEVTPFVGYMSGGQFEDTVIARDDDLDAATNFGFIFDAIAGGDDWRHYEVIYSRQSTSLDLAAPMDMDVQYLQIGGIVSNPDAKRAIPYFGLTIGATQLSPDGSGLDDETKLSFSAGGGVRVPITDRIGVRFDARAYFTLLNSSGEIFCVSSAGATCRIRASGDTFIQYSATLGVTVGFGR